MPIAEIERHDNRQLQNVANILAASKKVVVVTGAGISTNCGIPDFRSENGLYDLIQSQHEQASVCASATRCTIPRSQSPPSRFPGKAPLISATSNIKGKDLFSADVWNDPVSTSTFYSFIASLRKKIYDEVKQSSGTHRFIRTLRDSRRLVRCYTQNIDGLETREGLCADLDRGKGNRARFSKKTIKSANVPSSTLPGGKSDGGCEVVQLHGDLQRLRCSLCRTTCAWDEEGREGLLLDGKAPVCQMCHAQDQERRDRGKRGTKIGSLRPNIVLYGEENPSEDIIGAISTHDLRLAPDVLLILGTSLHVHGLKTLVKEFARAVHARPAAKGKVIFVNLTKPAESVWKGFIDYWISMDCDQWVSSLRRHRPDLWPVQTPLDLELLKTKSRSPKNLKPDEGQHKFTFEKENRMKNSDSPLPSKFKQHLCASSRPPLEAVLNESPHTKIFSTQDTAKSTQPPTPFPSGRRNRNPTTPLKRPRDDEDKITRPFKRMKKDILEIWQD
ncbi:hypothetical protein MMC07_001759 [Pseudocyphellaria aurata]|nr:hypothetical protein [Pseudocyphellaria aurata]